MNNMGILLDIDGVLADYVQSLVKLHSVDYPDDQLRPFDSWFFSESFKHSDEIRRLMDTEAVKIMSRAKAYASAYKGYKLLCENFHVAVATSRGFLEHQSLKEDIHQTTLKWLKDNNFTLHQQTFFLKKKEEIADAMVLIDDFEENLEAFRSTGRWAICLDRPWNQNYQGIRVNSLEEAFLVSTRIYNVLLHRAKLGKKI